ncbi:hypothetical protein KCU92_g64, partial [Aureobasidium melanogenum]
MEFEEELLGIRWPAVDDLVDVQDQLTGKLDFIMVAEHASHRLLLSGPATAFSLNVLRARDHAMTRLEELSMRLPSKPVFMIIKLIKEVWRRFDVGDDSVFWLDVMHENGWQTVIG